MPEVLVIGIGPGHPDQITVQAVEALNRADVLFLVDKGAEKRELIAMREEICRRHIRDPQGYRTVEIADPPRDRNPADAAAYHGVVADWHQARAERFEAAFAEHLAPGEVGALLVWGDPALYDSTLRVFDRIALPLDVTVIPGVTSINALTAGHRIPLNRIGEPIHITTGRRIAGGLPDGLDSAVVMLDAGFTAAQLSDPDLYVYWGAYVSTSDEVLIAGPLAEVAGHIAATKEKLRAEHGWIMDTYLLVRRTS
jgi:precorrin-6A synthase